MCQPQRSRVIPACEYRRERWRNQLGWTREIATGHVDPELVVVPGTGAAADVDSASARGSDHIGRQAGNHPSSSKAMAPGAGTDWDWRLSIAEIEQDADFSGFPGVERELVLLSGNGLRLQFDGGQTQTLLPPHGRARFSGESRVRGELVDGRTTDFNLMWRRDRVDAELWHRPLVGPMVIFAAPHACWAVHLFAGQARFADASGLPPMEAGDTAILAGGAARVRHVLDGGGEALVIRLEPRAQ